MSTSNSLVTSDIHLSDDPLTEYRWGLLPWLQSTAKRYDCGTVLLLGDLTVAKDKHAAMLVNRLAEGLMDLARQVDVVILKANHDYLDEEWPFFRFLGRKELNIHFIVKPTEMKLDGRSCLLLPHTRDYEEAWDGFDFDDYDVIFCHQTFDGAIGDNGFKLEGGIPPSVFKGIHGKAFSGDVHTQQKLSKTLEYVGAPYHVNFGDKYEPRVLMLGTTRDGRLQQQDCVYDCLYRHMLDIESVEDLVKQRKQYRDGDQMKVRVHLKKSDFAAWPRIRKEIVDYIAAHNWLLVGGIELKAKPESKRITSRDVGVSSSKLLKPMDVFKEYADERALKGAIRSTGKKFLEDVL